MSLRAANKGFTESVGEHEIGMRNERITQDRIVIIGKSVKTIATSRRPMSEST